jgi:isopentenyl diphosphate isomerase/L-lactate dehydrogenase-like FMN-dependent dehydrogenase
VLKALMSGGREEATLFLDAVETELRSVMLLTGSATIEALRRAPHIIGRELEAYLTP